MKNWKEVSTNTQGGGIAREWKGSTENSSTTPQLPLVKSANLLRNFFSFFSEGERRKRRGSNIHTGQQLVFFLTRATKEEEQRERMRARLRFYQYANGSWGFRTSHSGNHHHQSPGYSEGSKGNHPRLLPSLLLLSLQ